MIYKPGTQLFAGGDIPEHHEEARKFIRRHELTWEQVKLVVRGKDTPEAVLLIICKTEVELRGR